jgi:ABC-type amino acid transport substrate-binding protein
MRRPTLTALTLALAAVTLSGCASTTTPAPRGTPMRPAGAAPLVIGVTSDSPPYAARKGDELFGMEVDFARVLGEQLQRPITFVDLQFSDLIPALEADRIDVIMAGLTVTRARELRLAFTEPYLQSGLVAVMRRGEMSRYKTPAVVRDASVVVGVVETTTGEKYAREHMQASQVIVYPAAAAAMQELRENRVDLVITDAPIAAWFVSKYDADIGVLTQPLNQEPLAWALRRDDPELLSAINAALHNLQRDGTLERILSAWVPFWRQLAPKR